MLFGKGVEMNRDDIIRMAREVGMELYGNDLFTTNYGYRPVDVQSMTKFAALVAAAEREACAKVAENRILNKANCTAEQMYELQKKSIAAAIRERGAP